MQLSIFSKTKHIHINLKVENCLTFKSQNKMQLHKRTRDKAKQDGFGN